MTPTGWVSEVFVRRRESPRERGGFGGYSRTNAGSYHERLATRRARLTSALLVVVAIVVAVGLFVLFAMALRIQNG